MSRNIVKGTLACCFIFFPIVLNAQWIHDESGGAFDGNPLQIAFTGSGAYGFGVRCSDESNLEIVFMTPDKSFDNDTYDLANITNPTLMLRIDDLEPREINVQLVDNDGEAGAIAKIDSEVVGEINQAKTRIAVALKLLGEVYHETEFGVAGSTDATNALAEKCGVSFGDD